MALGLSALGGALGGGGTGLGTSMLGGLNSFANTVNTFQNPLSAALGGGAEADIPPILRLLLNSNFNYSSGRGSGFSYGGGDAANNRAMRQLLARALGGVAGPTNPGTTTQTAGGLNRPTLLGGNNPPPSRLSANPFRLDPDPFSFGLGQQF